MISQYKQISFKPMPRRQQGIVLFITLIALVGLTMVGIALMRNVDSGVLVTGNMATRQAALQQAEIAFEQAIQRMPGGTGNVIGVGSVAQGVQNVFRTDAANGYYAVVQKASGQNGVPAGVPDILAVNYTNTPYNCDSNVYNRIPGAITAGDTESKFCTSYIIERLCQYEGAPTVRDAATGVGNCTIYPITSKQGDYRELALTEEPVPFYRVTVRVDGGRNTVVFAQALIIN